MVHLGEMGHLMRYEVMEDRLRRQDDPPRKGEAAGSGATPPTAFHLPNGYPGDGLADRGGELSRPLGELAPGDHLQKVADAAGNMGGIAHDPDLVLFDPDRAPAQALHAHVADTMGPA